MAESGLKNPSLSIPYSIDDAVTDAGFLVKINTSTGTMMLCGAGELPSGYTFMSSDHPVTGTPTANLVRGVIGLVPGTEAYLQLPGTHAAVTIGAEMETAADGCVTVKSGAGYVVAQALEAIPQNTGGTVRCKIVGIIYYAS